MRCGAALRCNTRVGDAPFRFVSGGTEPRLEHYLFIFLRFVHTAVPTVELDYTVAVGG